MGMAWYGRDWPVLVGFWSKFKALGAIDVAICLDMLSTLKKEVSFWDAHFLIFSVYTVYRPSFPLISKVTARSQHLLWVIAIIVTCHKTLQLVSSEVFYHMVQGPACCQSSLQCDVPSLVGDKLWQYECGEFPQLLRKARHQRFVVQLIVAFRTTVFMPCAAKMWLWRCVPLLLGVESVTYFVTDRSLDFLDHSLRDWCWHVLTQWYL